MGVAARKKLRQRQDDALVLATVRRCPRLSLYSLRLQTGLRAQRLCASLDRLMAADLISDAWDESVPSRRRYWASTSGRA